MSTPPRKISSIKEAFSLSPQVWTTGQTFLSFPPEENNKEFTIMLHSIEEISEYDTASNPTERLEGKSKEGQVLFSFLKKSMNILYFPKTEEKGATAMIAFEQVFFDNGEPINVKPNKTYIYLPDYPNEIEGKEGFFLAKFGQYQGAVHKTDLIDITPGR